jgi:nucleoid DNA-binding protein
MMNARKAATAAPAKTEAATPAAAPAAAPKAAAPKAAKAPAAPKAAGERKKKQSQIAAALAYKDKVVTLDEEGKPIVSRVFDGKNSADAYTSEYADDTISANDLARLVAAETKHIFGVQMRASLVKEVLNAYQTVVLKAAADGKKVKTLIATFEGVDKPERMAHNPREREKKIVVPAHRVLKAKPTAATKAFVRSGKAA